MWKRSGNETRLLLYRYDHHLTEPKMGTFHSPFSELRQRPIYNVASHLHGVHLPPMGHYTYTAHAHTCDMGGSNRSSCKASATSLKSPAWKQTTSFISRLAPGLRERNRPPVSSGTGPDNSSHAPSLQRNRAGPTALATPPVSSGTGLDLRL